MSDETAFESGPVPTAFAPSEAHDELRRTVRAFLRARSAEADVRALMATDEGYDPAVWAALATELELVGLTIPQSYGGSGFTVAEQAVVLEEMGRRLLCAPYFSTAVLAVSVLVEAGDAAAAQRYLPRIATGELIATAALLDTDAIAETAGAGVAATRAGDGYVLDGVRGFVFDGLTAGLILVPARDADGVAIYAVDAGAAGLERTSLATLDQTRKQARLAFTATPATRLAVSGDASSVLSRVLDIVAVALAAEQVGGAAEVLDDAVAYAKTRVQFGVPIGSFQAIKHKCADVLVALESAKSLAYYAAWAAAYDPSELAILAPMAKAYCSEAYLRAASANIQVHGGLGFTWEHTAHLYFKRAKSSELLLGSPRHHRRVLADRIGV